MAKTFGTAPSNEWRKFKASANHKTPQTSMTRTSAGIPSKNGQAILFKSLHSIYLYNNQLNPVFMTDLYQFAKYAYKSKT